MKAEETKEALLVIAREAEESFEKRLSSLSPEAKTERGVLTMARNYAKNSQLWLNAFWSREPSFKEKRVFELHYFDKYREAYDRLTDEDERNAFLIYAFAVSMERNAFYDRSLAELRAAEKAGEVERTFKTKIAVRLLGAILKRWQQWWQENGSIPCGVDWEELE